MTSLKRRAPLPVKQMGRRASVVLGERTAGLRMTPSFVMAGAQRCGTTSLFRALIAHPSILPAVHHKGVNYFDVNYHRGPHWYQGHFPLRATARLVTRSTPDAPITFDASGYYLYHPLAPARLARDLPDVKVIVMLRDPVERAWSAYKHERARGFETETFERALRLEDERVQPDVERMVRDESYQGFSHRHHSYRRKGQYAEQLLEFTALMPRERVHVVDSHDFFAHPEEEFRRVTAFLGVAATMPASFGKWNARPGTDLPEADRAWLQQQLEPHDRALADFLGAVPSWRRG